MEVTPFDMAKDQNRNSLVVHQADGLQRKASMTLVNENSEKMKSPAMTSPVSVGAFNSITKENFGESRVKAKDN